MSDLRFDDGDLVLVAWHSCGEALARLADQDPSATVFVPGPTFDRDCRMSVAEFADATTNVDVLLGSPRDDAHDSISEGEAAFLPAARAGDYPLLMRRLAADAERVVGVIETSVPCDGTVTPGINGLGISTIASLADVLVAEVNRNEPRLPGLSIPVAAIDHRIDCGYDLPRLAAADPDRRARAVGDSVAEIVPDGATLHIGYGEVSTAVANALTDHADLGLHSGLVSPAVRPLVENGVITRGSVAASLVEACPFDRPGLATTALGPDRSFYEWVESSQAVAIGDVSQMHDPCVASENPKVTAINSGLQVDLFGQINAERLGARRFGGPGGQPDFFRIARKSEGGRGILALLSETDGGTSKVVGRISAGGVVTTPAYAVDYVVTEHAVADLRTASERDRAERIVRAAPPGARESLRERAAEYELAPADDAGP